MSTALLVDTTSIYALQKTLKDHKYSVQGNINYGALLESLRKEFPPGSFKPMIAFAAVDPESDTQRKFVDYLAKDFLVDQTDYRDAFILPDKETQYQRLSTRIAYVAGMLAVPRSAAGNQRSAPPDLVVVTDAFDTYHPLMDYANNRGGKVSIVFFRAGMEDRWRRTGILDENKVAKLEFRDLSDRSREILGVDIGFTRVPAKGGTGLAGFNP